MNKVNNYIHTNSEAQNTRVLNNKNQTAMSTYEDIINLPEFTSDISRARAWIRLALEKKSLYEYLKEITEDNLMLLYEAYVPHGLIRVEDKRLHLLLSW